MAPWELEQLPLSPSVYPCINTSLYLCLHVPACARRGVLTLTNPLKDGICYQREHYLFLGFSSHARSVSLRPPLTLNFFLYFSLYHSLLRVFFPPLSRFARTRCELSASLPIRGQPRGPEQSHVPPDQWPKHCPVYVTLSAMMYLASGLFFSMGLFNTA